MTENLSKVHTNELSCKREKKTKINANSKTQIDFEILKLNEYDKLLKQKYSIPQVKANCRYYGVKLNGNKQDLIERLYNYLFNSYFIIKIQKLYRKHLINKYNKCHGPAFIKRHLCVNESDFLTMEDLKDIHYNQFYSYTSEDKHIYGFDIVSLYTLVTRPDISALNPYTRSEIPKYVLADLKKIIKLSKILKIPIDIEIKKEVTPNIQTQIDTRTLALFQKMDELGNYTNIEWFSHLTSALLAKFIRELYDIWAYRAQLSHDAKREICHPNGDPFNGTNVNNLYSCNLTTLKLMSLNIIEKFVYSGINRDCQILGASYVLSALTLVSNGAADAMPWLYYSVAHVIY